MKRAYIIATGLIALSLTSFAPYANAASASKLVEVYKSPTCGCCGAWIEHMQAAGFTVKATDVEDMSPVKAKFGVHEDLESCHTAVIDGHVLEGHVPADDVKKLLAEGGEADGLAVPGMPIGSPGMEQGDIKQPYQVIRFNKTSRSVFAQH